MNELLVVPLKDQFDRQAGVHRQIRDSLYEVVSTFDIHYDTILSQLDSSQAGQIASYQEWWQTFKTCLLQHATLHDQFAQHLEISQQNYHENDSTPSTLLQTDRATSQS